ncbi:MAG: hypothetical protein LUB63_07250 [Oscillospiraceae bacterium]|nr:hypothetical protein [Oscillospiraceae bacterium]
MKKFLALILALTMVIFCFVACSDTADSEQEDADSTTSEAATSEVTESENQEEDEQENEEDEAGEESTGPTNRAEAVGIYSFGTTNSYGTGVQYALWLNGDGTAYVFYNSSFSGLSKYIAEEWAFNEDGTASVGALTSEDGDPQGDMFDADNGYTSIWVLNADGTCVPQDWTGVVKIVGEGTDVGDGDLPEEAYPLTNPGEEV